MMALIFKEFRQLFPFALIWFCLLALTYGAELFGARVDESSYFSWCGSVCDAGTDTGLVLVQLILFLIAAYSLFPREIDDSTIDFLHSLPVSRGKVFTGKFLATVLMLWLLLLIDYLLQTALLSLNTQTVTGKRYWRTDILFYVRDCLFAVVIVCHGIFLSWFRTAGLLLYAAYLIVLMWLEQTYLVSGIYSIFGFFSNEYDGPLLVIDWKTIIFHLVFGFVLLFIAFLLWRKTDSKQKAPSSGKLAKALPTVFSVFAFLMAAGYMVAMMQESAMSEEGANIARLKTEHYAFSYRESDEEAMRALEQFAEDDYAALVELLGAETSPVIQTDMTSDSTHALGLASWKKIRMILTTADEVDPLYRRVLSHETAHVFQSVESDQAFSKVSNSVNFFIEGMAQYTSFRIVADDVSRESNWLVSSVSWKRHNIKFVELANRSAFAKLYDPEMLYGIGDIWVAAMVQVCGEESIGNFLRAAGRDDAPPNLFGVLYWRNHLQYIGCELEQVNNQWRSIMQNIVDDREIGAFPHYENVLIERNELTGLISISADLKPGESGQLPQSYYVRIMSEAQLANTVSEVINGTLVREGENARVQFSVLPRLIDGRQFRFQLGYMPLPKSRNYFEKWRSGSLPE